MQNHQKYTGLFAIIILNYDFYTINFIQKLCRKTET